MKKEEDILYYDFQGWPTYKQTLRDIISSLGFKLENNKWTIDNNDPKLDIYPRTLEDDGMGYGINEKFIESISQVENNINIFIAKKDETEKEEQH